MINAPHLSRQRLLIIGAGRRVQNNFLPVLACLGDRFEIAGIHSRTEERLRAVADQWGVPAVTKLQNADFSKIDVVAMSIPLEQNAIVIRQLLPHAPRLHLVIDTPVAGNVSQLFAIMGLLKQFKNVTVTEDYMNFPQFSLLRKMINDKVLGSLKAATLYNMGYRYHGLALIRSLIGFKPVLCIGRHAAGSFSKNIDYRFVNGFKASVIGPYRPYENGGIVVEGSAGILTEVSSDSSFGRPRGKPVYRLVKLYDDNLLSGFAIDGTTRLYEIKLPAISLMRSMNIPDKSDLNLLRGCGLMEIFQTLDDETSINHAYGINNALYDSLVSKLALRGLLPVDPLALAGQNVVGAVQKLAAIR